MPKGRFFVTLTLFLLSLGPMAAQEMRVGETINVSRVIIDTYVLYDDGSPVLGLEAKDFRVRIDRKAAEIESVEWVSGLEPNEGGPTAEQIEQAGIVPPPRGRLIVMFFQTDFQRDRVVGQLRMIKQAKRFLESLTPDDRVAVVSFDSHLKLRQDFTSDTEKLTTAIERSILIDYPGPLEVVPEPSLRARLSAAAAKESGTSEEALYHVANALLPVPGPKALILFGWGLGRFSREGVTMQKYYEVARIALEASRTTVFTLDISNADFHSLEVGLRKISRDTGGFYEKTHVFTQMAMDKLTRAISGHYVLVVRKPAQLPAGRHSILVEVPGRRVDVLARKSFSD